MPRRLLTFALGLCALLALPTAAQAAGKHERAQCANAGLAPAAGNLGEVRVAVLCLNNRERAARGLPALKEHEKLQQAAEGHSLDMVAHAFFAHESPDGADMVDRILRTGYARDQGWSLGENIAWGTAQLATPGEIHRAWMGSAGHRANILRRQFREIGIGIALGTPVAAAGEGSTTYTADFGIRR